MQLQLFEEKPYEIINRVFTGMFVSIEFVHQLQNLIYILTNEELTLNN